MNITLYEAWYNRKPHVRHLKVFSCISYALIDVDDHSKIHKKIINLS
ncbi:unnamed protein product [Spirodela intermedia]|uniref:Uncharacterized protein n=1 Tax=Spirodela intermedia TaxID=51605 RepID=A0A7I8LA90_SPIIN|nr:unnamed protein product [Spirodela intermedia]